MKTIALIFIISLFSISVLSSEVNGLQIASATESALTEASIEVDANSIFSWEAATEEHEVIVKVLNEEDVRIKFGCHEHDKEMVCHEEFFGTGEDHYHKDPEVTLEFIKSGSNAAVKKLQRTLERRQLSLAALTSLKVWTHEDDHDDDEHEHGANVWTKFQYKTDKVNTIFALCHVHGEEKSFSCHYRKEGKGEPKLSF